MYIFISPIPKNLQIWPSARAENEQQSFHFQKITGTLKKNIFFDNLQIFSFTLKNNCEKKISN